MTPVNTQHYDLKLTLVVSAEMANALQPTLKLSEDREMSLETSIPGDDLLNERGSVETFREQHPRGRLRSKLYPIEDPNIQRIPHTNVSYATIPFDEIETRAMALLQNACADFNNVNDNVFTSNRRGPLSFTGTFEDNPFMPPAPPQHAPTDHPADVPLTPPSSRQEQENRPVNVLGEHETRVNDPLAQLNDEIDAALRQITLRNAQQTRRSRRLRHIRDNQRHHHGHVI